MSTEQLSKGAGDAAGGPGPVLELRALRKYFTLERGRQLHAVDDVTLAIAEKEVVGLVGESGCGKSTLGKTVVGLLERDGGEVRYRGALLPVRYDASAFRKYARRVHMIFQDPYSSLDPRMTVREIIAEGPRLHGLWGRREVPDKVGYWLERVGLSRDFMSRYAHEFSGGQRQRIGIARALALEPEVVVCDEPISALDVSVQAQVVNLLAQLKETMGLTLLFIAHDLSMIRYISDRMAVMYLGQLVELGPANDVYFRAKHPYTQSLVISAPESDPHKARRHLPLAARGEVTSPVDPKPGCRFSARCPQVMPVCRERDPEWLEATPGHFVACHLFGAEKPQN
ncbi:MAG: ABC transporter ATP-binding protein [Deltaproteobacteria bacterium]